MINFAPEKQKDTVVLEKVHYPVLTATTIVLVVYIVSLAGFLGWTWFSSGQQVKVSSELADLRKQVSTKSEAEVVVRNVDTRSKEVLAFLKSRSKMAEVGKSFLAEEVKVEKWDYQLGGENRVKVGAENTDVLQGYVAGLVEKYDRVWMDSVEWSEEFGWVATINVGNKR